MEREKRDVIGRWPWCLSLPRRRGAGSVWGHWYFAPGADCFPQLVSLRPTLKPQLLVRSIVVVVPLTIELFHFISCHIHVLIG